MLSEADADKLFAYEGYLRYVIHAHLAGRSSAARTGYTSDVLQDSFARLQESPRDFRDFNTSELVGYARQTAINTSINLLKHLRARLRHVRVWSAAENREVSQPADSNPVNMADLQEILDEEEFCHYERYRPTALVAS
jgi:DNA-directed RNA polymerase specialized sigma24 family protein